MIRRERRLARLCLLIVGLGAPWTRTARAEPPTTIVLVRTRVADPGRWRAAELRTRDELRMLGLRVLEIEVRDDPSALASALAEHGARTAVHVARDGDLAVATVWSTHGDATPTATRLGDLAAEGTAAAALTALRVAEVVRVEAARPTEPPPVADPARADDAPVPQAISYESWQPQPVLPPTPPPADIAGPPVRDRSPDPLELVDLEPATAPPPPRPPPAARGAIGVYAGAGGGPGGAGALVGGAFAARRHVARLLALQGELQAATSPGWLSGQERQLRVGLAGARAALVLVARRGARVSWHAGVGGGVTFVWALGRTPDLARTSRDRVTVGVVTAGVHAAIRARDGLRVVLGVDLDLLLPPIVVRVLGVDVARVGAPVLRGALGLEWDVWRGRR